MIYNVLPLFDMTLCNINLPKGDNTFGGLYNGRYQELVHNYRIFMSQLLSYILHVLPG